VPTSDETAVIAALAARALGLRGNAPEAAYAARNKRAMREALAAAGIRRPRFATFALDEPPRAPSFPCVVKPLLLSASRGVIRPRRPPPPPPPLPPVRPPGRPPRRRPRRRPRPPPHPGRGVRPRPRSRAGRHPPRRPPARPRPLRQARPPRRPLLRRDDL